MSKPRHRQRGRGRRPSFWRGPWPIVGVLAAVVVVVIGFILLGHSQNPTASGNGNASADPTVVAQLSQVRPAVLDAVGTDASANPLRRASGTLLVGSDGRPEVLYVGAEWCPYCAAERWAMAVALSHFGSFSGLHFTTSAGNDVFPDTHTLSFNGSIYTSAYLRFIPVELEDRNHAPLQNLDPQEQQIMQTYDPAASIPFIDIANQYTMVGQGVPPDPLQGLSWQQIASALSNPDSPITKVIVGNANYLTAAICKLPGTSGASICSSTAIKQVSAQLPG